MTGRVAALVGLERIAIQEYELPSVAPGAALLKVKRANVCGSDLHIFHHLSVALRDIVLGHEFVAEVAQLGEGLATDSAGSPVAVGDRIAVVYFHTCRHCPACDNGEFNACYNANESLSLRPEVYPHFHGAFASHFYLDPGQYFYKVPDSLTDAEAAGANCAVAASSGARVVVVEQQRERAELARQFGATDALDLSQCTDGHERAARVLDATGGLGADIVLEVTGRAAAFSEAIDFARIGGNIASVGNLNVGPGFEVPVMPAIFTRKNLRVHGYLRYDPWYLRRALDFMADNRRQYPFGSLSDRTYSLDQIGEAFARAEERRVARVAIVP